MPEIIPRHSQERVIDAMRRAQAQGCALYTDGKSIFTAPARLNRNWRRVGVSIIPDRKAA